MSIPGLNQDASHLKKKDFEQLKVCSRRYQEDGLVLYQGIVIPGCPKFGFVIKRHTGKAVLRNRGKRQVKAILDEMLRSGAITEGYWVFVLKKRYLTKSFQEKRKILGDIVNEAKLDQ